jgi:hypothetical protein
MRPCLPESSARGARAPVRSNSTLYWQGEVKARTVVSVIRPTRRTAAVRNGRFVWRRCGQFRPRSDPLGRRELSPEAGASVGPLHVRGPAKSGRPALRNEQRIRRPEVAHQAGCRFYARHVAINLNPTDRAAAGRPLLVPDLRNDHRVQHSDD